MGVEANLEIIQRNINEACDISNRDTEEVTIIGVTKYVTIERAQEAVQAGIINLAENRMEGILEKKEQISNDQVAWHFIGTLQSRKVKHVIDSIDYLHSLDRLSLAKEIDKRSSNILPCFIQVNVSGEDSKHGLAKDEVDEFVKALRDYPNIQVVGLMTMAPFSNDETEIRTVFRQLRELRDTIQDKNWEHAPCPYLSMGMSHDYIIAIEEGATHIRIGSSLVGTSETR